eukprot:GFYU01003617.1.p1 GENE.GFYU01003617.1~~GFYU01003617.1.p1  ORF type:complete len:491 (-),score=81.48 GFYU01003617.1:121-1593(-)
MDRMRAALRPFLHMLQNHSDEQDEEDGTEEVDEVGPPMCEAVTATDVISHIPLQQNTMAYLKRREMYGTRHGSSRISVHDNYLPIHGPTPIARGGVRVYMGHYNADGSRYLAATQDSTITLFDSTGHRPKISSRIRARHVQWTLTDATFSPCEHYLMYSSITPYLHLVDITSQETEDRHELLDLSMGSGFGIWSVRFSGNSQQLVAGTSDCSIHVYDIPTKTNLLKVHAHDDDINAVAFAEDDSNIIYSGSDDSFVKVWDRRILGQGDRPAGVFVGHTEGISFLHSKGDGKYVISNSKDQKIKLWDIRHMAPPNAARRVSRPRWDYRWGLYPRNPREVTHPDDCSVMTYVGHHVLQTLIRCYFSPRHTTGQRYIYTGSADGKITIYDVITGEIVARLTSHCDAVRDLSWHPTKPILASASFDGQILHWTPKPQEGSVPVQRPQRGTRASRHVSGNRAQSYAIDISDDEEEDEESEGDDEDISSGFGSIMF